MLRKAGANWVEGDRFFDREVELKALSERVRDGTHTLLTAQRRMGKTSLVRELLRRLKQEGCFQTVFVDLEGADTPADAVAEIGVRAKSVQGAWPRIKSGFANALREAGDRVDSVAVAEVQVKLRAAIDAGNWRQNGATRSSRLWPKATGPWCSPSTSCPSSSTGCSRAPTTASLRSDGRQWTSSWAGSARTARPIEAGSS